MTVKISRKKCAKYLKVPENDLEGYKFLYTYGNDKTPSSLWDYYAFKADETIPVTLRDIPVYIREIV